MNINLSNSLPIEEVAKYPLPGMAIPGDLAFSPDDRLITYLYSPDRGLVRQLYSFDIRTGEQHSLVDLLAEGTTEGNVSREEALRRERLRQRELGVTHYAWAKQGKRILISARGNVYVSDGPGQPLCKVVDGRDMPALDPQFSPDGNWVAFVQDSELYVVPSEGGELRQLTTGARGTGKTHGLAEFVAQEEMGRLHGFWWSPDSLSIAFEEVDETHIPVYPIVHQGKDITGDGAVEEHHYPFAGMDNARVRLGVVRIEGDEPTWMDIHMDDEGGYLARVQWFPDGRLTAQLENRAQTGLDLVTFDLSSGTRSLLLHEESEVWINIHDMLKPLESGVEDWSGRFLWASERSGFRHLYLYDGNGKLVRQLTSGDWMVDDLAGVDKTGQEIYFTASLGEPRESQLYAVPLNGGEPRRLTPQPGMHTIVIDHACQRFLDTHHSLGHPPTITLRSLSDGATLAIVYGERDPRVDELALRPPELVTLQNRAGDTLYGALYRPSADYGKGPYPTLVMVYGGPHAQLVINGWTLTVAMRAQYLCSLGFQVFVLDNRGSARRGLAFEGAIKNNLGRLEVEDQVDGVRWLVDQGLADPKKVGIFGWSYGGYMAVMCLSRAPETFAVAMAGAPVAAWDGYDTHYTERYMGKPRSNPKGYEESSVLSHVENITGRLMLVHGLIDENVHFRHTARLINALILKRKPYKLLLFPDERHMPRRLEDRVYMEECIRDFFLESWG